MNVPLTVGYYFLVNDSSECILLNAACTLREFGSVSYIFVRFPQDGLIYYHCCVNSMMKAYSFYCAWVSLMSNCQLLFGHKFWPILCTNFFCSLQVGFQKVPKKQHIVESCWAALPAISSMPRLPRLLRMMWTTEQWRLKMTGWLLMSQTRTVLSRRHRVSDRIVSPPPCTWQWWTPLRRPRLHQVHVLWMEAGMWHLRRALWHGGRCTWRRPLWRTCSLSTPAWVCMDRHACGVHHWPLRLPHHPALPSRPAAPSLAPGRPHSLPERVGWSSCDPVNAPRYNESSGSWPVASWSGRIAQYRLATGIPSAVTVLLLVALEQTTTASANLPLLQEDYTVGTWETAKTSQEEEWARWEILRRQNSAGLPEREKPPDSQQKVVVESKVCVWHWQCTIGVVSVLYHKEWLQASKWKHGWICMYNREVIFITQRKIVVTQESTVQYNISNALLVYGSWCHKLSS